MNFWTIGIFCLISLAPRASSWLYFKHPIDTSAYYGMPRMYEIDSFDSCPEVSGELEASAPRYCIVSVLIDHPKMNTNLFELIQEVSAKKLHFKHDRLKRGICVQTCLELYKKLENPFNYQNDEGTMRGAGPLANMYDVYNKFLNVCINKRLSERYGFLAKTSIDYCIGKNLKQISDSTDIMLQDIFIIAFILIVFLLAASFSYETYKHSPKIIRFSNRFKRTRRLLDVFSIKQNLTKFLENESNDLVDLSSFHASKLLIMFMFIFAHVYRVMVSMPFDNPEEVEKNFYNVVLHLFDLETVAHLFFVLSSIELTFVVIPLIETSSSCWALLKAIVGIKYHKLVTLFSTFILFNASFLHRIGSGPFWEGFSTFERNACRYNWRLGILTLTNYAKPGQMCLEPTWILSTELHMAVVSFVVLYLLVKFPRCKELIFGLTIFLSVVVVGFTIYREYLTPIALVTPEVLRSGGDVDFTIVYQQSHMNCGSFLIATMLAFTSYKTKVFKQFTSKESIASAFCFYSFVTIAVKFYFSNNSPSVVYPRLIIGTYMKYHHGIFLSLFALHFICGRTVNFKYINTRTLKIVDKLFVAAFLCSLLVTRLLVQNSSKLQKANFINLFTLATVIFVLSYLFAIVIHLVVEMPFVRLKRGEKYEQIVDATKKDDDAQEIKEKSEEEKKTE